LILASDPTLDGLCRSLAGPPAKVSPAAAKKNSPKAKPAATTNAKKKSGGKRKKAEMGGVGRTIGDDGPPPPEEAMFKSEENIIEKIARAASGGAADGDDTGVSYLRDVLATALVSQQAETLANMRFKAMLGKKYEIEKMQSQRLGDDASTMIKVSFKGDSRATKVDEVDLLPVELLEGVWAHVIEEGAEGYIEHLKPFKMALTSPRCFWSMVHHFGDVETGLRSMFPDRDWNGLEERAKRMSEKALENQRQEAALAAYEADRAAKLARGEDGAFEPVN